jgi:serine/threonine protein kinase/tetratricopeptide (TPR) repeat protein
VKLSRELWLQVEPLLAAALEMEASARAAWLASIESTHPAAAPVLRRILESHERAERSRELETVPRLAPGPGWSSPHGSGARIGPFELLRPLGHGGMGEVWLARQADGRIERDVALKLPAIHQQRDIWRERFRRERDILARLEHPNIARLYDAGVTDFGQPWLAMEFVEGLSLSDNVVSRSLSIPERLVLFRQVLAAVAHAHRYLVVHRDLKPANILVDANGQVKLLDFGIAKLVDDGPAADASGELTRIGGRVMTLRYAAPEQVAAGSITTATDIYSLGVILHELLTGLAPYRAVREGKPLTDVMLLKEETAVPSKLDLTAAAARGCGVASPKQLARLVSGDLDAIVLKAMRRDPADRYASVELFDEDVVAHLERRPVRARAGTWRYLAGRFAIRHKLPLAMAAVAVTVLAASLVMIERERRVAVAEKARAERHFASVRKLANSFIFDVHGKIENLAGSLEAREMLVKTSLEYLDSLASEAGNDPALMFELAAAYRKIGNVQGEPGAANTGDLSAAMRNFAKSKELFVALERLKPDDIAMLREHRKLSYSLARGHFLSEDPRWQAEMADTIRLSERITILPDATSSDRAQFASAVIERANLTSIMSGQSSDVEATIDSSTAMLEALVRGSPGQVDLREALASAYDRAGKMRSRSHRTAQSVKIAISNFRRACDVATELSAEFPNDARKRSRELDCMTVLAYALDLGGEYPEADRTIGRALAISQAVLAEDPKDATRIADYMRRVIVASVAALRVGDNQRAIRLGREGLAVGARLPADIQKTANVRLAFEEARVYIGYALLAQAQKGSLDRDARLAMLREARSLFASGLAYLDAVRAEKLSPIPEDEVKQLHGAVKRCEEAIARLEAP